MKRLVSTCGLLLVITASALAQTQTPPAQQQTAQPAQGGRGRGRGGPQQPPRDPPPEFFSKNEPKGLVEFELMTWPEVYRAIHKEGKTTALIYFGGTESRGPQNVNGGHTIMGRAIVKAIAIKLGNAIALPVIPYSQNNASNADDGHARPDVGDSGRARRADRRAGDCHRLQQRASSSTITAAARTSTARSRRSSRRSTVRPSSRRATSMCSTPIRSTRRRRATSTRGSRRNNLPVSGHAGIPDTSTMMYLQEPERDRTSTRGSICCPWPSPSRTRPTRTRRGPCPRACRVTARQSDVKYGKMAMDIKIDYAVKQIQEFLRASARSYRARQRTVSSRANTRSGSPVAGAGSVSVSPTSEIVKCTGLFARTTSRSRRARRWTAASTS